MSCASVAFILEQVDALEDRRGFLVLRLRVSVTVWAVALAMSMRGQDALQQQV